jgi:hypothetical protein
MVDSDIFSDDEAATSHSDQTGSPQDLLWPDNVRRHFGLRTPR